MTDMDALTRDELASLSALASGLPIGLAAQERLDALAADDASAAEQARSAEREQMLQAIISESTEGQAHWAALLARLNGEDVSARDDAIAMLEDLTERDAPFAIATLGGIYEDARYGRAVDGAKALAIYLKGARGGDFECMYRVGSLYQRGHGVAKDLFQAMHWYEQAKDRNIFAFDALLRLWHKGYGGPAAKALLTEGHKKMIGMYDYMMSENTPRATKPKFDLPVWLMICAYQREFKDWRA